MNNPISSFSRFPTPADGVKVRELTDQQAELGGALAARRLWAAVRRSLRLASMNQSDAAAALRVNRSTISRAIQAPSNMTIDRAGRIARSAGYYLTVDLEPVSGGLALHSVTDQVASGTLKVIHTAPGNSWAFTRIDKGEVPKSFNVRTDLISNDSDEELKLEIVSSYSPKMSLRRAKFDE